MLTMDVYGIRYARFVEPLQHTDSILWLTGDHAVGKLSAMDQPIQPSIPLGSENE